MLLAAWSFAPELRRHLVMTRGRTDPDCILYRLGRTPFLLRKILSFETSKRDVERKFREKYLSDGGEEADCVAVGASVGSSSLGGGWDEGWDKEKAERGHRACGTQFMICWCFRCVCVCMCVCVCVCSD